MLLEKIVNKLVEEAVSNRILSENPVRRNMDIPLPEDLLRLAGLFKLAGRQFYLVGGSVRDAILGQNPKDFDLATDADPDEIVRILKQNPNYTILEIGKSFGVIKVITPEGGEYEIATFRKDIGKGRRPDSVEFATIDQDVMRRDLTINALFYDIEKKQIVDYVGGLKDIENNIIQTVGSPEERFEEDRLRILRALRFAGRMGAGLNSETAAAIKANNSLQGVSGERIRDEFLKGIKSAKSVPQFFSLVSEFGLWPQIFPGLNVDHSYSNTKNLVVQLALLLRNNEPKLLGNKLNAMKYSADEVSGVQFLNMFQKLNIESAYKLKKLMVRTKLTGADLRLFAREANKPEEHLVDAFIRYEPSVTGEELQAQGLTGQQIGQEINRRETELFRRMV